MKILGSMAGFLMLSLNMIFGQTEETRPNIILILADDMGSGDISTVNGGLNRTPNLDQLIKESVFFSEAYSASPVCTPSRAALLTGRYPHRTGAVTLNMQQYPEISRIHKSEKTIADIFNDNGYVTAVIGKWHVGDGEEYHPLNRGFDQFQGFKGYDVSDDYYNYRLDVQGAYQNVTGEYLTENLSRRAVNFVKEHKQGPFFLHLAHYAPHRPLSAPEDLINFYEQKGFDRNTSTVYAMIEVMDKGIGDLMRTLDAEGIRDNTLVIFASDNGPDPMVGERYNLGLRGTKYTVYDGGIKVPLMFNWKGRIIPSIKKSMVHLTDIFPTLLEICKIPKPTELKLDGGSIANVLLGENGDDHLPQYRFWQWNRGTPFYSHNAAVRDGDWKLVKPYITRGHVLIESTQAPLLFNVKNDPAETTDLAKEEKERYNRMSVKLEQWAREVEWERLSIR